MQQFLRLPQVRERTGLSRSTIYKLQESGDFPKSVALGPRSVAWVATEIDQWIEDRIARRDAQGICRPVTLRGTR
jgi:prophage regulatory protein